MPKIAAFEAHHQRYEAWFEKHQAAYISELLALRPFVPYAGKGIEIGVGSARFAAPLGIQFGVDPSPAMLKRASERGIQAVQGTAENLPFIAGSFDYALVVTTICFVDSPDKMLSEAYSVLKTHGRLIIGFIDRESRIGLEYQAHRQENVFYRDATFFSAEEVESLLIEAGFSVESWGQTLARPLSDSRVIEPLLKGRGQCAFVVVSATKKN